MNGQGYVGRAVRQVFNDGTIWWRVAALSAMHLVPILGSLFATGYLLVLMRDAAWGIDRGLPRFGEYPEILKRGLHGFVIALVLTLPVTLVFVVATVAWTISTLPATMQGTPIPQLSWWYTSLLTVATAFLMPLVYLAYVRASVYLQIPAGLSVSGLRQLVDMDRHGFVRVAWLPFAAGIFGAVMSRLASVAIGQHIALSYPSAFLVGLITVTVSLVVACSYGLWAQGTDPRSWPPLREDSRPSLGDVRAHAAAGENSLP